jgi:hypothetical protein
MKISRCNRGSTSSSQRKKGEGHRGLEERKGGVPRETSSCAEGEKSNSGEVRA